jgi:tRNA (cmo5U34)-methyltransferase
MGDVVVPDDPADSVTPLSQDYDLPSTTRDLVDWLQEVGFDTRIVWAFKDVAIFSADRLEPFSRRPRRY